MASCGTRQAGQEKSLHDHPGALAHLYKNHLQDVLKCGVPNQSLFEAYLQYCFSPKHTVGEQLLTVRRDKRERAAYEKSQRLDSNSIKENVDEAVEQMKNMRIATRS